MAADLATSSPPLHHHHHDSDLPETPSPVMSRYSTSITSDGASSSGFSSNFPTYLASSLPLPCYISQESASRVASELFQQQKELEQDMSVDPYHSPDRVEISATATAYANSFLDKLLHDVLALAHSTQLSLVRHAAAGVLKKSLGEEAVRFADANLEDLLALEVDESSESSPDCHSKWDLEYVWKRSRLRVMMRSENSDFDIDDDERYAYEAGISGPGRAGDTASHLISLQSELFLAGILDFISDHLLAVALIPASIRVRRSSRSTTDKDVLLVEDYDMERGVLNSPLDRHWRAWRKSTRSRTFPRSPYNGRSNSIHSSPTDVRRGSSQWSDGPYHTHHNEPMTPRGATGDSSQASTIDTDHAASSTAPLPKDHKHVHAPHYDDDIVHQVESPVPMVATMRNSLGITTVDSIGDSESYVTTAEDNGYTADGETPEGRSATPPSVPLAVNRDAAAALNGSQPLSSVEGSPNARRSVSSITSISKRHREVANGVIFPHGLSIPKPTAEVDSDGASTVSKETSSTAKPADDHPGPLSAHPVTEAELENLEAWQGRSFGRMRAAKLSRSDSSPLPSPSPKFPSKSSSLRIVTRGNGLVSSASEPNALGAQSATEISFTRPRDSPKFGLVTSVTSGDRSSPTSNHSPRKVSAGVPRLTDDLARARGSPISPDAAKASPKLRQASTSDNQSLRRIAVDRNGSLAGLADDNASIRRKAPSIANNSVVSAEDFDSLISGGDTIKMTLSPSSVRDAPAQPMSLDRSPSLRAPSIASSGRGSHGRASSDATEKDVKQPSRPLVPTKSRNANFMAREATVQSSSTKDFADFIRSTGPDADRFGTNSPRSVPDPYRLPSVSEKSVTSSKGASSAASPRVPSGSSSPSMPHSAGIKYKRNYVPREATGTESSGNSNLIDFIRSGPGDGRQNMPSRDIAPFRYSLDDEDYLGDGGPAHRASVSTINTAQTAMTYNSRAPLVHDATRQASLSSPKQAPTSTPAKAQPAAQQATRKVTPKSSNYIINADGEKRYRNKDPYALDFSDDEEDVSELDSRSVAAQSIGTEGSSSKTTVAAKASPLISTNLPLPTASNGSLVSPLGSSTMSSASAAEPPSPIVEPKKVVIPRNPNRQQGRPTQPIPRASTRDLADFFRNEPPPPPVVQKPLPPVVEEKKGFWRKKRYVDMP